MKIYGDNFINIEVMVVGNRPMLVLDIGDRSKNVILSLALSNADAASLIDAVSTQLENLDSITDSPNVDLKDAIQNVTPTKTPFLKKKGR